MRIIVRDATLVVCCLLVLGACGDDSRPLPPRTSSNGDTADMADMPEEEPRTLAQCTSQDNPAGVAAPGPEEEVDDYRFALADGSIRSVEGTVLDTSTISTPSVIARAVLIGTGAFLDEGCITSQKGASYSWKGVACTAGEGTLLNVLVVEPDPWPGISLLAKPGMTVRFSGFEIDKFNDFSPGGGTWQDGGDNNGQGQVSLWLTDLCLPE